MTMVCTNTVHMCTACIDRSVGCCKTHLHRNSGWHRRYVWQDLYASPVTSARGPEVDGGGGGVPGAWGVVQWNYCAHTHIHTVHAQCNPLVFHTAVCKLLYAFPLNLRRTLCTLHTYTHVPWGTHSVNVWKPGTRLPACVLLYVKKHAGGWKQLIQWCDVYPTVHVPLSIYLPPGSGLVHQLSERYRLPLKTSYNTARGFFIQLYAGACEGGGAGHASLESLPSEFIKLSKQKNTLSFVTADLASPPTLHTI